ncbi:MAG: DMT family transporter [Pseudomonadota bacterium]
MNLIQWVLLLFLSILWGSSFVFAELSLNAFPPSTVIFLRVFLAAIALLTISQLLQLKLISYLKKYWRHFLILGFLNNFIPFSLIVWGQTQIQAGTASILNASLPIFMIILAHFWRKSETITINKLLGILIGIFGVIIAISAQNDGLLSGTTIGKFAIIGACLSYAIATNYAYSLNKIPPLVTTTCQISFASLFALPFMLLIDQPWTLEIISFKSWIAISCYALFSTALAYLVYFYILNRSGATNVSLVTLMIPVVTIFVSRLVLDEQLAGDMFIGMIIIIFALILIDGRLLKFKN